jgi:phage repressor protein C with HTH and peptisase S24 domain
MKDFSTRLKSAMSEMHVSRYMLAKKCSISPSTVTNWITGKTVPDKSKVKIVSDFLEISEDWLMTGIGAMKDYSYMEPTEEELRQWNEEQAVESASEIVGDNDIDLMSEIIGLPKEKVKLIKADIDARQQAIIDWQEVETRPRIPLTAAAGSLSNAAKGITLKDCEQMPIVKQFPSYDFTMFVKGDSMSPKYESGDEIACRWIDQSRFIQWGKIHVLDTSQGIVIKKVYEDGEKIRCVSINTDYPAFSIPKEDVYSMALVIGALNISEM